MRLVPVGDRFTQVDDGDYAEVSQYKWNLKLRSDGKSFYAFRYIRIATRKYVRELLHHFLIYIEDGQRVDHWDGDGLNNQRSNLRVCTQQENSCNQTPRLGKYKGVSKANLIHGRYKPSKGWRARIRVKNQLIELGHYETQEDAAKAYDEAALLHFGHFAKLNFPVKVG